MTFARPTLQQIQARIQADIATYMPGADATVRRTAEYAIGTALADAANLEHGHLVWLAQQLFPDTAVEEFLMRQAALRNVVKLAATYATTVGVGQQTITGTNGSTILAGAIWQRADGAQFAQVANATISGTTALIDLTAVVAGSAGNSPSGTVLTLASPVAGITSQLTLGGSGILNGFDVTSDSQLRANYLSVVRQPPTGGGPGDYINWAKTVAGVTRAWQFPAMMGYGTVGVTFVLDGVIPIIPNGGNLTAVQSAIEAKCPVQINHAFGTLNVFAPSANPYPVNLHIVPNTSPLQTAVTAAILDLLTTSGGPGQTVLLSALEEAVGNTPGITDFTIASPTGNVVESQPLPGVGGVAQVATLGTITFT